MSPRPGRWKIVGAGIGVVAIGVLAFLAYGGTPTTGSTALQVRAWVKGSGLGQSIGTVVGDAARVRAALDAHKAVGVLRTDCGVLVADSQAANGELPTPDHHLTNLLSSGYTLAYDAGNDCYDSGGTDQSLLRRSVRERIEAEARLQHAVTLVDQLTGAPLSTTTTTQPGDTGF
ncbi:MAG: hypothetical protein ACRDYB_05585 [Acidimicrobiales bacterium]